MEIHFFGHGKVMDNHCWKRVVTVHLTVIKNTARRRVLVSPLRRARLLPDQNVPFAVSGTCGQ